MRVLGEREHHGGHRGRVPRRTATNAASQLRVLAFPHPCAAPQHHHWGLPRVRRL